MYNSRYQQQECYPFHNNSTGSDPRIPVNKRFWHFYIHVVHSSSTSQVRFSGKMEIQAVEAMSLEPFELHTVEHFSGHSPSEYLSTKFYLPAENSMKHVEEKEEVGVDLWTKAVDNMFKSSRLFNSDLKEEEKENVHENLLDNGMKEASLGDFHLYEEDQALKEDDKVIQDFDLNHTGEEGLLCEHKSDKVFGTTGDQIVPTARGFTQTSSSKRRFSDLDVDFGALPSFGMKPGLKKIKLNPETGKEVIEEEGTAGDYDPPRNSIFVDYSFDPRAKLPSFREAFVPALKRISRREKELRKKLKDIDGFREVVYPIARDKTTCNVTPVEGQNKSESGDQPSKSDTGASLDRGSDHHNDILSELNQVKHLETIDESGVNLSPQERVEESGIADISHFGDKVPNNDLKIHIKQEDFEDCSKHLDTHINGSPGKILGINSANLKDIEKNIFNFEEGLDMLDLEREFPLQNIGTSHAEALSGIHNQGEAEWGAGLSHVTDMHQATRHNVLNQGDTGVSRAEQYVSVDRNSTISSLGGSFAATPVTNYSMPLHHNDSSVNVAHFESSHQTAADSVKYENGLKRFELLGYPENHQPQEMNVLNMNGYMGNRDKTVGEVPLQHNSIHQFPHDMNMIKQPLSGIQNSNGVEGHMIARQIHQSFGADVFGAPGDDGAKILAKYLAQRGSTRPDNEEQRGSMTSAISSLISKSFSQQEANQRLQRESGTLDFLHTADFENLDIIENF